MKRVVFGNICFWTVTVIMVMLISLLFKGSAHSMSKDEANKKYYLQIEREYISNVRQALDKSGYQNAGVMLTSVTGADGERQYTLSINHRRIKEVKELATLVETTRWPLEDISLTLAVSEI